jgi:hypothetical protein
MRMAIDYKITDLKTSFSVSEASFAWCDADKANPHNINNLLMMESALIEAIKEEEIKAEVPYKVVERRIRGGRYDMEEPDYERAIIPRKELIRLAKARGQKPKFLFPEMRSENNLPPANPMISHVNIIADNVVVTPTQKPVTQEKKVESSKPTNFERESELHRFIERVYDALYSEFNRSPTSTQVYNAIRARHEEFDTDDIIQEVTAHKISWASSHGHEQDMQKSTVRNIVSKIRTSKK